jgi:two-component system sensor histidine kinase QseC
VLAPFVLLSLALVWPISGWSLRPVARASREAAAVGPANPAARITADRLPDEIRPLAEAVNAALDRLARAYVAERRLTADAAHELRTPLAVLSLRLQKARLGEADWPAIERDVTRLGRLVGQLMDLARRESPARGDVTPAELNLSRIVRQAAAQVLPLAEEAGRLLEVDAPDEVRVPGHADDLRDMLVNLLDNALVHGAGTISVAVRMHGERVVIEVSDAGPGVPEALREEVFDRFRKGRAASPGAGLGLAIVRQVARDHGGDVRFLPVPGGRVEVVLPIGRPHDAGPRGRVRPGSAEVAAGVVMAL